ELRRAKTNAHVISLEDTKKVFSEQMAKIQQAIFDSEAELAERQASLAQMTKLLHPDFPQLTNTVGTLSTASPILTNSPTLQHSNSPVLASSNSLPSTPSPLRGE